MWFQNLVSWSNAQNKSETQCKLFNVNNIFDKVLQYHYIIIIIVIINIFVLVIIIIIIICIIIIIITIIIIINNNNEKYINGDHIIATFFLAKYACFLVVIGGLCVPRASIH